VHWIAGITACGSASGGFVLVNTIRSVAAIIECGDDRILLQKRDAIAGIYFPGFWGLFGGAAEDNETPEQAVRREIDEELGVSLHELTYFLEFQFTCPDFDHLQHCRTCYVAKTITPVDQIVLAEGSDMRLFAPMELPKLTQMVSFDAAVVSMYFGLKGTEMPISPVRS